MTTENVSGEQAPASQQQTSAPEGFIELNRYTGLVKKVDELVRTDKTKDDTIADLTRQLEAAKAEMVQASASTNFAVSERDKRIQEQVSKSSEMEAELRRLKSLEAKVNVAEEIGRPELFKALKNLPDLSDMDALKLIAKDIANTIESAVSEREKQLLSGVSVNAGGPQANNIGNLPTSEAEWQAHISKQELGTKEYQIALDKYGDYLFSQHK